MTIGAGSLSERALAMQPDIAGATNKPPKRRTIVAQRDVVAQPEAR